MNADYCREHLATALQRAQNSDVQEAYIGRVLADYWAGRLREYTVAAKIQRLCIKTLLEPEDLKD